MALAIRLKTFPEIFAEMIARDRRLEGPDVDLLPGSARRSIFEIAALQDAEQYVQLRRILDLFSLDRCKGDDLDERAVELGSDVFTSLRRQPANTSLCNVIVGDGTLLHTATTTLDASFGAASFTVDDATEFPTTCAVALAQGTDQEEDLIVNVVGNVLSPIYPSTTLGKAHPAGTPVTVVSIRSTLASDATAGTNTATLATGTGVAWASSGSVIFERDTLQREKLTFTRSGDVLTLGTNLTFTHLSGTVVYQSTTGSDRAITTSSKPYVPPTSSSKQINFHVTTAGTMFDGDFVSGLVPVESDDVGADTRAGSNTITKWQTPPFSSATVTNPAGATRGADREKDDPYRQRLKDFIQSLTRATPLAINTLVSGLTDPSTNTQVAFSQLVEPVAPGASILYITDGTSTFTLGQQPFLGRDVIVSDATAGDRRGKLSKTPPFSVSSVSPISPRLFVSVQRGAATTTGSGYLEDTSQAFVVNALTGFYLKTDDDQFYLITSNTAIRIFISGSTTPSLGSYSVFNFGAAPLTPGVDFQFNEATGDVELTTALLEHDGLVAASDGASLSVGAYLYSTGLAAFVQKSVNGDPTDFLTFPGYRATGTKVVVSAPTIIAKTFIIKVVAARGFTDEVLKPGVSTSTQSYVNSGGIGEGPVLSEIIKRVKGLSGVKDVFILAPTSNPSVPPGTLMRITDDDVEVV